MADKKEMPIDSEVVMRRVEGGWFVYVVRPPNKTRDGLNKTHASLAEGIAWVKKEFDAS